MMGTDSF